MVIATEAMKLGVHVLKPLDEHTRYDLIFDVGRRLLRVQCKWAPLDGDVVTVRLASSRYTSGGRQIRTPYSSDEIDAVAAYNWGPGNMDAWIGGGRAVDKFPLDVERYRNRVLRDAAFAGLAITKANGWPFDERPPTAPLGPAD